MSAKHKPKAQPGRGHEGGREGRTNRRGPKEKQAAEFNDPIPRLMEQAQAAIRRRGAV